MAQRRTKRTDYRAPAVRTRPARPTAAAPELSTPPARESAFPPGTLRRVLVGGLLGAVVLCAVAAYVVLHARAGRADAQRLQRALTAGSCTTDRRADPLRGGHVADPVFRVDPPAGGTHTPEVAKAGVYAGARVPPEGRLVHALEHGYVVLWHRPDVPVGPLAAVEAAHPRDVLVVERPSLPVPVAATAWGRRLLCGRAEPPVLERFVGAYVGRGPEDLARG